MQGAEPSFLPNLVCDQICQPLNEDEDEMKIDSRYRTDPELSISVCKNDIQGLTNIMES